MSEPELKPCPGCGSAATTREVSSPELVGACSECSFAAFITDWNTRAATAAHRDDWKYALSLALSEDFPDKLHIKILEALEPYFTRPAATAAEWQNGFTAGLEVAAKRCEGLVTSTADHHEEDDLCGWCEGLEQAANEIRALPLPPVTPKQE